jgi:hypothetical protein
VAVVMGADELLVEAGSVPVPGRFCEEVLSPIPPVDAARYVIKLFVAKDCVDEAHASRPYEGQH